MRNYWLKIAAGALGIFAVGMLVIAGVRSVKTTIKHTMNSSDPIPIPLIGLVPFKVDSAKLGSVSRLEFLRSDPEHVSGVRVVVNLADSTDPGRIMNCMLALDQVKDLNDKTSFRCQAPAASPGDLEPFGTVEIKGTGQEVPLLLPQNVVADLRSTRLDWKHGDFRSNAASDSLRQALGDAVEARADSVDALNDQASSLEESAARTPLARRRSLQHSADSVRTLMRAVQDRMLRDQARLAALSSVPGLTQAQQDSLRLLGKFISDSVREQVRRALEARRVELEKLRAKNGKVAVPEAVPATPPPPPTPTATPVEPAKPR
ncbi:MAG TPA: hypothetical protein VNH46_06000 [Gemmatimonadales bacterium]|nr:hypothetical protein [Gemmatimonadales bacterium]